MKLQYLVEWSSLMHSDTMTLSYYPVEEQLGDDNMRVCPCYLLCSSTGRCNTDAIQIYYVRTGTTKHFHATCNMQSDHHKIRVRVSIRRPMLSPRTGTEQKTTIKAWIEVICYNKDNKDRVHKHYLQRVPNQLTRGIGICKEIWTGGR